MHEILLLIVGFLAAFGGTLSGGGGALLSIAALLYLGLPINQAIATNKLSDLGFFLPAIRNFQKAKLIKKGALPPIIAIDLLGAIIGTLLVIHLDTDTFKKIIAGVLIVIIASSLIKKQVATTERPAQAYWPAAYFASAVCSGMLGAGTGLLRTFSLIYARGFTALQAMAHGFYANAVGSTIGVGILLFTDLINYRYAIFLGNYIPDVTKSINTPR